MLATTTHYLSTFNANYIKPAIDWSKNRKMLISSVGIGILLGTVCYKSPVAFDIMKKNIKFLTITAPIIYTIPAPVIGFCMALTGAAPGGGISYDAGKMFEAYCNSIVKVWQAWFKFVGISV